MVNYLSPWQRHLMTPHNTLRCVDGCIVTKPVKFWAISSIFTEIMRKPCFMVSIVLPWQRPLKKSQNCPVDVFTAGLLAHVKFEHVLNIFIGVIHYIRRLHYSLSSLDPMWENVFREYLSMDKWVWQFTCPNTFFTCPEWTKIGATGIFFFAIVFYIFPRFLRRER